MKNLNEYKYYLHTSLWYIALMMINGSVMQSYLLELGVSSDTVSTFVSLMQIVQVTSMLLFAPKAEKVKKIIVSYAITYLLQLLIILAILFMCYFEGINLTLKFYIIAATELIASAALGINNVLAYKVPYHIFDMKKYGTITGISGTVSGCLGVLFSAVLSFCLKKYNYFSAIKGIYFVGAIFVLATVIIVFSYKNNGYTSASAEKKKIQLFKYKPFLVLFIPNLLRGFNTGVILLTVTIGYHLKLINGVSAGYLIIITNVATILSSLFYSYLAKFNKDKWVVLISSGIIAVTMPFMCAKKSTSLFLIMYAMVYFVFNLIAYAVPILVTKIVDYNVMGQYSAWRMLLHTAGSALAGVVCIPMIDALGVIVALLIVGTMQLVSGLVYFIYCSKKIF